MAFVKLTPVNLGQVSASRYGDLWFKSPVINDSSGTPINFSTWDSIQVDGFPNTASANNLQSVFGSAPTVVGNSDGTLDITISAGALGQNVLSGTATLLVRGKPTSGDNYELLARGILSISNNQ